MTARPGTSLLEMLVVTSIVAVLSTGGVVGYIRFQERQRIRVAALQVASDLRLTQQKALSGEKPAGWCTTGRLAGWRLTFSSETEYALSATCTTGAPVVDKTVALPGGASGPAGTSIEFRALSGSSTSAASVALPIRLTVSSGTLTSSITVTQAGAVSVQ